MCSPCKQQKFIWSNGSYCNFCQIRATALAILYFLPLPGKVRKNDPSLEFGTQGAIQALYQLRHHGQQYLGLMLSHDLDTPLTQWSYCRPDILVCWMQLQGQGQCRMTKESQLQVTSRALLSFWTSIFLSGIPPPSKSMPGANCDFDAHKMSINKPCHMTQKY